MRNFEKLELIHKLTLLLEDVLKSVKPADKAGQLWIGLVKETVNEARIYLTKEGIKV
jgi:hypothetical protein